MKEHKLSGPSTDPALLIPSLGPLYDRATPISYALLRIAFGLTILTHGIPKILNRPHGSMADPMAGTTHLIETALHLPFAPQLAFFVALLETFGAAAVALGAATRLLAPMLAVQMAFICVAIGPTYPWIDRGIEYPVILGFIALLISFQGGGRWSVDSWIGKAL
ncbi:DoxX family protein [Hyphomonas hirschiana VP5]|uniref:DoxX family protein n=1 Tax=Hyphomonas hirschiana VP5 TaxID=1280951 RepID=A0A059FJ39_9PROT|nr:MULTISPECIES: DoxX family protein [Hyphomonas]KCZ90526.1 DoxX family protein [Hyphomonas hirschiana VP5]